MAERTTIKNETQWYVMRQPEGTCAIAPASQQEALDSAPKVWGPFPSQPEAIARRVGLIRAGKCKPVRSKSQEG